MIRMLVLALVALLIPAAAQAGTACTLLEDPSGGRVLLSQGDCNQRVTPASTFKIPLAVMGYDAGVLTGAHTPAWPYREEYKAWRPEWKTTVDPTTWLRDSVVWYSRVLTGKLGMARFQRYVDAFDYGNRDLSGHPGAHDGLTNAWLTTSLQISPVEQAGFIRKLLQHKLPASAQAQEMTARIMPSFDVAGGWTIHGKTGSGAQQDAKGVANEDRSLGWFVGWATKGERTIIVVRLIKDDAKIDSAAGIRARAGFLADAPGLLGRF
jgi:beta-lactamase class D